MNIEDIKKQIVENYGLEPTVCFYYYLWNAIDYVGRDNVKESFDSISGLGDEVIVGDYCSDDGTKELAEECGLKVITVEKTPGVKFHESKINNKIFYNSKCNFMVDLDVHTVYPKNLADIVRENIIINDITKTQLVLRGLYINQFGKRSVAFAHCSSGILYKPFLLEVRGFDERTSYGNGTTYYILGILEDIYDLEMEDIFVSDMIHRFHMGHKVKRWANTFDITVQNTVRKDNNSRYLADTCLEPLRKNAGQGIKHVKNSYW